VLEEMVHIDNTGSPGSTRSHYKKVENPCPNRSHENSAMC